MVCRWAILLFQENDYKDTDNKCLYIKLFLITIKDIFIGSTININISLV
jgi:hypothetical protein